MNDIFSELIFKFTIIKRKGFVKSLYYDSGAAGKMFETLLNKKLDNKCLPDFESIEIKTLSNSNKYPITLFSCLPVKNGYTPGKVIEYLLNNYGYNKDIDCKCLMINVKDGKIKYCKNKFGFMIKVSNKWKKIYICIFYKNKIFDTSIHWNFNEIHNIFNTKLKHLVCVKYIQNITHSDKMFYYYNINCYVLKSFDDVLFAIKKGIITINFNFSISNGIVKYHGINFVIYENDLPFIYKKIM